MAASLADKLLKAHVAFELEQWKGKTLLQRLDQEVDAFWTWAQSVTLNQVTGPDRIDDFVQRVVLKGHLPDGLTEMIGNVAKHLIGLPANRKTKVSQVIGDDLFDEGVDLVAGMPRLREEAVRRIVNSPAYTAVVGEVLYSGIADYVASANPFADKAPGVASLLSKGAGVISKRLPGLEGQLEKRLRAYIESNSDRIAHQSEKVMLNAVSEQNLRKMAAQVWSELKGSSLSMRDVIDDGDADAAIAYGYKVWLHLRETPYLATMIREGIRRFFADFGDRSLAQLLEGVGVGKPLLQQEAHEIGPWLAEVLGHEGYLEAIIRRRLDPFYRSASAKKLLAG